MKQPDNDDRADLAGAALDCYVKLRPSSLRPLEVGDDDVTDLLTDLMHWCHQKKVDWPKAVRYAQDNFKAEQESP